MAEAKKTILVAEDNRVLSDVIAFNLKRAGFDVVVARDGLKAVQCLRSQPFDLLITDYQMPGVNGEQLCRCAREELGLTNMPILMCSAKGLELDADQLRAQWNVSQTIHKPFSMREIISLAGSLLASEVALNT